MMMIIDGTYCVCDEGCMRPKSMDNRGIGVDMGNLTLLMAMLDQQRLLTTAIMATPPDTTVLVPDTANWTMRAITEKMTVIILDTQTTHVIGVKKLNK